MIIIPKKISIIGAGMVGSSTAFALMESGLVSEIALIDINHEKAEGEAMDLAHAASFIKPVNIYHGDFSACQDSQLIIYTAGANQKEGESRIDLVVRNTKILAQAIPQIIKYAPNCIILMVANPVDIMTYFALKISQFPPQRVIGSGTVLDSSRFRFAISDLVNIDARNIHGYIIGEHGDTEVPVWSLTTIGGMEISQFCHSFNIPFTENTKKDLAKKVRNAAYEIIEKKGATYYAVALAIKRIAEAILRDENSILTISSLINGEYGLTDVCLSIPSIINKYGRVALMEIPLSAHELASLKNSAKALQEIQNKIEF